MQHGLSHFECLHDIQKQIIHGFAAHQCYCMGFQKKKNHLQHITDQPEHLKVTYLVLSSPNSSKKSGLEIQTNTCCVEPFIIYADMATFERNLPVHILHLLSTVIPSCSNSQTTSCYMHHIFCSSRVRIITTMFML